MYDILIERNKFKKLLCIGTEVLNTNNYFPRIMKEFIFNGLLNNETVIVFTDDILYKDLKNVFNDHPNLIIECLNKGILQIRSYDTIGFNKNSKEFLELLGIIAKTKNKIWMVWDFKNVARKFGKLDILKKYIEDIFSYSNDSVYNLVYMNNSNYSTDNFISFLSEFDALIVKDRNLEMYFECKNEVEKAVWALQSSAQLKYENSTLVLFNDMFSNIPKTLDKYEFKNIIINKLKHICDADYCMIYSSNKEKNNILSLDSFFGITKRHKYYLINDREILKYQINLNNRIHETQEPIIVNIDDISDKENIKNNLQEIGVQSCIGVFVEYYDIIKGIIWIGRYKNNKQISKMDIEYIQSICKTSFYLIQEQNRFSDLQNKLIENEKLRAMGEMAAGIAHDINNILTPIIGSVQLLKDTVDDKNILKQLKIVEICAYDGMNITNKVKKITKQYNSMDKLEIFEMDELLTDALDLTKNKWLTESAINGIKVNMKIHLISNSKVKGNPTEIREVFINIIRNAIDAMPSGGTIEISSKVINKNVVIEISDNGMGMNEEVCKRVFEPFFTTKGNKGSGLGLSVSYKIIQSHNGFIKIDSKENIGTCFKIELPICEDVYEINDNLTNEDIEFNGSILIIDDQPQIRNVVGYMIKSLIKCKIKSCGCENIDEEIKRRKYDIVICDFSMPEINGLQVAKILKDVYKDSYFCLMTGWVGNFEEGSIANVDFVLNKPINKEKIREMFVNYNSTKY